MAWEDLEQDIAEEFSDNRRLGWIDSGFSVIRRAVPKSHVRPVECTLRRKRGPRPEDAAWRRGWRARRRFVALLEGRLFQRCQRPDCCNLLPPPKRGAPQRFCSRPCKDWRPPLRHTRTCTQCPTVFTTRGRRTTCSNACRQRAWYYRRAGTAGASAGGAGTGAQE